MLSLCCLPRVVDIASHHYNNISAARTQHKVYMWGQCQGTNSFCTLIYLLLLMNCGFRFLMLSFVSVNHLGLTITTPVETPFSSLHEVFACFADIEVTYKPIQLEKKLSQSVTDSLRLAFDDQVMSL